MQTPEEIIERQKARSKAWREKNPCRKKEYAKQWSERNADYYKSIPYKLARRKSYWKNKEARFKARARRKADYAVVSGKIKKEPCEVCKSKAQIHLMDFNKPFEITWMCQECFYNLKYKRVSCEAHP